MKIKTGDYIKDITYGYIGRVTGFVYEEVLESYTEIKGKKPRAYKIVLHDGKTTTYVLHNDAKKGKVW